MSCGRATIEDKDAFPYLKGGGAKGSGMLARLCIPPDVRPVTKRISDGGREGGI